VKRAREPEHEPHGGGIGIGGVLRGERQVVGQESAGRSDRANCAACPIGCNAVGGGQRFAAASDQPVSTELSAMA
jgi:hypothetical protein